MSWNAILKLKPESPAKHPRDIGKMLESAYPDAEVWEEESSRAMFDEMESAGSVIPDELKEGAPDDDPRWRGAFDTDDFMMSFYWGVASDGTLKSVLVDFNGSANPMPILKRLSEATDLEPYDVDGSKIDITAEHPASWIAQKKWMEEQLAKARAKRA
jgi:hypothetical protein